VGVDVVAGALVAADGERERRVLGAVEPVAGMATPTV